MRDYLESCGDYLLRVAIAFDQLVNALLNGYPDETMSSRCWRLSERYWYAKVMRVIIDALFRFTGPDHCKRSFESENSRKHAPFTVADVAKPLNYAKKK